MAKPVIMPKFGFTQETSVIVRWLVQPGQAVEQGDPIAEVSTDKVDMEVEAPESGILDGVRYAEGEEVPVTAIIAYIRQPDEVLPPEAAAPEKPVEKATPPPPRPVFTPADAASPTRATPVAMRVAADLGVDIAQVPGSGPRGRVTRKDVEWADAIKDGATAAANAEHVMGFADGTVALYAEYTNNILYVNWRDLFLGQTTPEEFVDKMVSQSADYWGSK